MAGSLPLNHLHAKIIGFFIIAHTPLTVIWDNCKDRIESDDIVIGSNFDIINESNHQMGQFCCIVFNPNINIPPWKHPSILTKKKTIYSMILPLVEKAIKNNPIPSSLQEISNNLFRLFEMLQIDEAFKPKNNKKISNKIDNRLILINRYIRNNLNKNITLQELADLIGCNPIYLSNTYSKVFNISPIRHLQIKKIQKAKQLLKETNLSIADISSNLGFYSISHFSDLFKKHIGISPSKFRKI